jgi:glucokinase
LRGTGAVRGVAKAPGPLGPPAAASILGGTTGVAAPPTLPRQSSEDAQMNPADSGRPFLATDIGGTHARLALVRARPDGAIDVLEAQTYACAAFDGLAPIVADFLAMHGDVDAAAIGCTGMRQGDTLVGLNLPWAVPLDDLRALGIARVSAVNDFVAVAHAAQCMADADGVLLTVRRDRLPTTPLEPAPGPVLVVGPGTGFGAALRVPVGAAWHVLPSDAGQISLAPGNVRERALLAALQGEAGYVGVEQVVSGPGLLRTYRTLCALDRCAPRCTSPADVASAAAAGEDAHAAQAIAVFCAQFGSVVADIVLVTGATRVFVAGGIVARILKPLLRSDFHARFLDKGAMRGMLERVPVRLIDHPHRGVIGAASWYVRQAGEGTMR